MNVDKIKGIIVPLITPVDKDENIDEAKLRFMIDHVIENGVHGVLLFGSNGEFFMFNEEEIMLATRIAVEHTNKRVPVYFGLGEIRTRTCMDYARKAVELGVDGVSILQPMFVKPTEEELYNHFSSVALAVPETPVLLYNNPGKSGYPMSYDLVERLANDIDNIVGMKDSSGDMTHLFEFIRRTEHLDFKVLVGKDTLIYPALCIGAAGAVCSTANMLGTLVTGIYTKYVEGNYKESLADQFKLNPVRLAQEQVTFPAATKDMANLLGLDVGDSIRPVQGSTGVKLANMEQALKDADLL